MITHLVTQLLSLAAGVAMVFAAVLFLRANQRMHTWMLMIGTSLSALVTVFEPAYLLSMVNLEHQTQILLVILPALRSIAGVMTAYGLISVALIQYRESKEPFTDH